jgi:MGT family glycosyltransferase
MAHIVLHTTGSLGDLHPYLAVGRALVARGHRAVVATHRLHQARVAAAGLEFHSVRPHFDDPDDVRRDMAAAMDERDGSRFVLEQFVVPHLRDARDDLMAACRNADALVDHVLSLAAPLVAESLGVPRIHTILQPMAMFSAHDPPALPASPSWTRRLGAPSWEVLWRLARWSTRHWFREVDVVRREMGLSPTPGHPLMEAWSDRLNLALFSRHFAPPQPDWPAHAVTTGFPWYDGAGDTVLDPSLEAFLDRGPAPVVFTLGSSGVWDPGTFYLAAAEAVRSLGMRAVLLVGEMGDGGGVQGDESVLVVPYAPHSRLFPRASALVHHGGVGTTGQALRAGRPMVIVPYSHDQPDNATRCTALGVATVVRRGAANARRLSRALRLVTGEPSYAARAAELAGRIATEDGAGAAAAAIEAHVPSGTAVG